MRGVICCYSSTGNTLLACRYLQGHVATPFDLIDIIKRPEADLAAYDVVGFACPTDFWGVPRLFESFISGLPRQEGKPAFVFNTYGALSGGTLSTLTAEVSALGFSVVAGHSLRMPENYPPMIAKGMTSANSPSDKDMKRFDAFVAELDRTLRELDHASEIQPRKVKAGLLDSLLPKRPRTAARIDMGEKLVDEAACRACGRCAERCPYGAITLDPTPVFDMAKCFGCWRCYNLCPERAIHTTRFAGSPFYSGPSESLRARLR